MCNKLRLLTVLTGILSVCAFISQPGFVLLSTSSSSSSLPPHSLRSIATRRRSSHGDALDSIEKQPQYLSIQTHTHINQINREDWNSLLRIEDSPFLQYDWLYCLEESKCVVPETGWNPLHLTVKLRKGEKEEQGDDAASEIVAAVPCYIKVHSMGEFIFDNAFADAAYRSGIEYYPKLLVAVPLTPASGTRILLKDTLPVAVKNEIRKMIGEFLNDVAENNGFSSVHVNFCEDCEVSSLEEVGYMYRKSMQFHWRNVNAANGGAPYADFDDYLAAFKSKRRQKIKKERKSVYEDSGVRLEVLRGEEIPDNLFDQDVIFKLYVSTIEKLYYGRQYLNEEFFRMLKDRFRKYICLVLARNRDGEIIAGTFNVISDSKRFYGRYWGSIAEEEVKNLHFETCYYKAIEYAIEQGLEAVEPGAGGGDFKFMRGFDPVEINSVHAIVHPGLRAAVRDFLKYEARQVGATTEYLSERSAVGKKQPEGGG